MIKVLNKRVLIEPDPEVYTHENEDVNKALEEGKLVLPDTATGFLKKVAKSGKIVQKAADCINDINIGDKVYFAQFSFSKITIADKEYWLMDERDLYCVVEC